MDAVSILRAELTQPFLTQFCLWCRRWYTSADAEFVEPSDYHVVEGIGVTLNNLAREGVGLQ